MSKVTAAFPPASLVKACRRDPEVVFRLPAVCVPDHPTHDPETTVAQKRYARRETERYHRSADFLFASSRWVR